MERDTKIPTDEEAKDFASRIDYPRLITSLSLLLVSLQEPGKAALALEYIKSEKDLDCRKDHQERFLSHGRRTNAATAMLRRIQHWPDALDKRSPNVEELRQASLYVDFDFNFGIWVDPSSLGSPEQGGSSCSGAIFTGLLELFSGEAVGRRTRPTFFTLS